MLGRSTDVRIVFAEISCLGSYGFSMSSSSACSRVSKRMVYLSCKYLMKSLFFGSLIVTVTNVVCMRKSLRLSSSSDFCSPASSAGSSIATSLLMPVFWKRNLFEARAMMGDGGGC